MANEPERLSVKLAGMKGGALLWIAIRADHGHPVTRDEFVQEYSGLMRDAEYGQDLLGELHRGDLVADDVTR